MEQKEEFSKEAELRKVVENKMYGVLETLIEGFHKKSQEKPGGLDEVEAGVFAALVEDFQAQVYPRMSTILACAELLNLDVQFVPRTPQSKIIRVS